MEKRHYKATFILNLQGTKRDAAALTTWLKGIIAELGGKVTHVDDLGIRDFVRVTHKKNPTGHYLAITFEAAGDINLALQNKLKLEHEVKRTFVEKLQAA